LWCNFQAAYIVLGKTILFMKRLILTFLAILSVQAVVLAQLTIKDPNAQTREAKNFHGISVGSAFDVYLVQGNEEAVAVSASNEKDISRITVEVKDGILHIGLERGKWNFGNKKLKAYVSFKNIDKLDISGACDVKVDGAIKASELKVGLSGASDLHAKLQVDRLSVDLSGASDLTVSGTAANLSIEASGASNFKGFELTTDFCTARASGASDIRITVNKELSVHASGASDIDYKGACVIRDLHTSGASSVGRRS
jgi:hypothetical protein